MSGKIQPKRSINYYANLLMNRKDIRFVAQDDNNGTTYHDGVNGGIGFIRRQPNNKIYSVQSTEYSKDGKIRDNFYVDYDGNGTVDIEDNRITSYAQHKGYDLNKMAAKLKQDKNLKVKVRQNSPCEGVTTYQYEDPAGYFYNVQMKGNKVRCYEKVDKLMNTSVTFLDDNLDGVPDQRTDSTYRVYRPDET